MAEPTRDTVLPLPEAASDPARRPPRRSFLIVALGSVALLALVIVAGLFVSRQLTGEAGSVGSITTTPNTIRCDGSERTASIRLSATPERFAMELRSGGVDGPIVLTGSMTSADLGTRQADGSYRSTSTATDSWECLQPSGRYGLILRDPTTGDILASGEFSIEN